MASLTGRSVVELRKRLDDVTIRDAARLGRRLKNLRGAPRDELTRVAEQIDAAEAVLAARRGSVPVISYPDLPITGRRDEITEAITAHQVVVVAGETGSGKTTQLPKICLEAGRGVRGLIGHTQPRRLAARTVAQRIADELGSPLGESVGYTVRFTDRVGERSLIKLMTDGILLAEIERDRRLLRYDTLILDEAHERSLNIDFLLGYLRGLLPRRPDLKVIVTSATIEPQRFSAHFGGAPIIEVSGRNYPVEVRYRPLEVAVRASRDPGVSDGLDDPDDPDAEIVRTETRDEIEGIVEAVRELQAEPPGDILVFCSGEREIRDTAEALSGLKSPTGITEILPLYARLSTAEQQRVFTPPRAGRRVVLATNVAETSLTVPGIRYVVDPGNARISRYSRRLKVQRLPIEPISQASAAQRSGRCGRLGPGVCIRLYNEADFATRPRYTDPEVLRTNLAAVLLRMAALRLGDVEDFPFLDPPDARSVRDGIALLMELGAFDSSGTITYVGRRLARLPVDPRLARMILAAEAEDCVREILVLAAALTIPDPRERPTDKEEAARACHTRFADESSDFTSYLNLWSYLSEKRKELSGSAFRRMCRAEFLHYLRIREWQDLVGQLRSIARDIGIVESRAPARPERVTAALLAGLLSHVGMRREDTSGRVRRGSREAQREYLGARNSRFLLAPGSVLAKRPPRWVMVAELVETSRLYGRTAARIQPEMVERMAGDLLQRSYSEPHWDAARGEAVAFERITLYGLPVVARRKVGYGRVEPELSRELFIRHALVEGDWPRRSPALTGFLAENADLITDVKQLEERLRRRGLVADDQDVFALYDARIPADVVSARHFEGWWKKQRRKTPELLAFTRGELLRPDSDSGDLEDRPESWTAGGLSLPLSYRFDPESVDDGVTVHVPIDVLARLGGDEFAWQVPALREELVTALLRSLPKDLRRNFVPVPDTARAVLSGMADVDGSQSVEPLLSALQRELRRRSGVLVPLEAFDVTRLPAHLRVTFAVEGAGGAELGRGKDLAALQEQLAATNRAAVVNAVGTGLERRGLRGWPEDLEVLPKTVEHTAGGRLVRGYPGFAASGKAVDLRVFATPGERDVLTPGGIRRLLRCTLPSPVKAVERGLEPRERLALGANPDGSLSDLLHDCADAAVDALAGEPVWTRTEFAALSKRVGAALVATTAKAADQVQRILDAARQVQVALPDAPPVAHAKAVADVRAQLDRLLAPGFVTATGYVHLGDLTRYLTAAHRRLEQLPRAGVTDRDRMDRVQAVQGEYEHAVADLPPHRRDEPAVRDVARQIEELRVSFWAQQLGTPRPVSEQRIRRAIGALH